MTLTTALRRPAAAALCGVLATSALTIATATTAEAAPAPTTHVWVTKYHNVKMPGTLRPGVHRFVVRSARSSGFQIVRARKGYTKREAARDVNRAFGKNNLKALRRFERNIDLAGGVSSQRGEPGVMWARLHSGKYWALDTNPNMLRARKILTLHVGGDRLHGRLPGRHATLRAINETDWGKQPRRIPSSGRLVFRNASSDNHFLSLAKLRKGKTAADFADWVDNNGQGRPPVKFNTGTDTGVVSPGRAMSLKYDLPAGKYMMLCWWPDADMGGMPHVLMGMYRGITLR